ncbi:MAG: oligosaccharide flippase family protein [Gemmatimonadaceae bacterium]|nr:oligosaccharide flippase family protein [Gemmatimonadaceae bacterium]
MGGRSEALESGGVAAHEVLARAHRGTRVMTARVAAMRVISVSANLLLVLLVTPRELGLLAVARGTFTLLQYAAELGVGKALLRRAAVPTREEYAALSGLQLAVGVVIVMAGLGWPPLVLGFGAIDRSFHLPMLGTVVTMLSLAWGTGARVRLERALAYERLAAVDVANVLMLNVGLVACAAFGVFVPGAFVVLGVSTVVSNLMLHHWAPGPAPTLAIAPLRGVMRDSGGFLVASSLMVAREQGTAVVVGLLFGLPTAGVYSFAERVAQVLNICFDGYKNAAIPAASRLAGEAAALRSLATRVLSGSIALVAPCTVLGVILLPAAAPWLPRWAPAIVLTQWYMLAFGLFGVMLATLDPISVARRGAVVAMWENGLALLAGWGAFALLAWLHSSRLEMAVVAMYVIPSLALVALTPAAIRPALEPGARRSLALSAGGLLIFLALRVAGAPVWSRVATAALLPALALGRTAWQVLQARR